MLERAENFPDSAEPAVELKIRRPSGLGGSTPPPGTTFFDLNLGHSSSQLRYSNHHANEKRSTGSLRLVDLAVYGGIAALCCRSGL